MTSGQVHRILNGSSDFIAARFYVPRGEPKAAVLIASAMGTNQTYYAQIANWLAAHGYLVATFDYSGTGQSQQGDLRQVDVDIVHWGRKDCDAMVQALSQRAPNRPLYWLGHSIGGQLLGLVPNQQRISKAITIATGSGYWLENAPELKWRVWWLWFVMAPFATWLCGYFPGKRLRKVGDLPHGVMSQWRRWCLHPDYMVGVEGHAVRRQFASVTLPILSISFSDDEMMSEQNTASFHGFFVNAQMTFRRISPEEVGVKRIGHFGFFNRRFETSLWQAYLLPELT